MMTVYNHYAADQLNAGNLIKKIISVASPGPVVHFRTAGLSGIGQQFMEICLHVIIDKDFITGTPLVKVILNEGLCLSST